MKVVLTTLNAKYIHSSLALRYLKEYCKDTCFIEIREFSINNHLLEILGQLYEDKPQIIGFACYIWNIEMTVKLIQLLKQVLPETTILCGGPEVSYQASDFLLRTPSVDYIIQGEGEETLRQLLMNIQAGKGGEELPHLARRGIDHHMIEDEAGVVRTLDSLPFPYHDTDMEELRDKIIYYESTRGCPFACQYCLSSAARGVRFFSPDRVVKELTFFIRHDVRQIKFVDRTFNVNKSHYLPILQFLAEQDCQTNFHFEIAADLLDEEVLSLLETMPKGRVQLEIGIQSTNKRTLEEICRVNHWDRIVQNVTRLVACGRVHLHLDLIIGLPEEDYTSFENSFNDVYCLKPHMLQIGFLKSLKGSGIAGRVAECGYVFMETAPYQVLANRWLSYGQIWKLQIFEGVFEQYYNSGRFSRSLSYCITATGKNAFRFYEALTEFWREREFHLVAHTMKSLYSHLDAFCSQYLPKHVLLLRQLLKFDALISSGGTLRPDFLPWNEALFVVETSAFWRGGGAKQYLKEFHFTTWREIKKKYHIEVFEFDPFLWEESSELYWEKTPVLFSFVDGDATCQKIRKTDFWRGE